ncbi:hypothetical protein [Kitasatospora sp. A2-31]|uniref:hypothetical protein n=1 Tax=Kitasatospora sp. A2-31 TaxID=2916414 RepID=UPI001EEA96EA|nr:hypothetical protein [Kitasatospora sp. A2-31]MCG6497626.1 hypothetical protein [Kitasatospora sp. A2-31]
MGIFGDSSEQAVRAEHDAWARGAELGVTYYTALPVTEWDGAPIHMPYTFTRRAGWGVYTGQLITDDNTPSFSGAWFRHGPLTTERRPTPADYHARLEEISAAFEGRLQEQARRRWLDADPQISSRYPATARVLASR